MKPTPLCGGLVLWVMLIALSGLGLLSLGLGTWDWVALCLMALMGFLDDLLGLRARIKALVGLGVALILAVVHGAHLLPLGGSFPLFGLDLPNHWAITLPLLTLWFWFLPNAINLMDGVNGLVIGFSLLVLWFLGAPLPLLGALFVLLLFNYPRAHLFLGDCGALLLGTLMAILTVKARLPQDPNGFFVLFIYPMVDVSLVVFSRLRRRQALGVGDRSHLHHQVLDLLRGRTWLVTPLLLAVSFGLRGLLEIGVGDIALRGIGAGLFLAFALCVAVRREGMQQGAVTLDAPQGGHQHGSSSF
nr:MraY family glycosyltransferase [uncultured Holophaga sp.]